MFDGGSGGGGGGGNPPPPIDCNIVITNVLVRPGDNGCCCVTSSIQSTNCPICGFNILYTENNGSGSMCSFESNWESDVSGNSILLNGGPIGPGGTPGTPQDPLIVTMCATFSDDAGFTISYQPYGCNGTDVFNGKDDYFPAIPQCPFVPDGVTQNQENLQPGNLSVGRPYPSPASSEVKFDCNATEGTYLTLTVFNADGTSIQADDLGFLTSGPHTLTLYTQELKSGKYFAFLSAGPELRVIPFAVVK